MYRIKPLMWKSYESSDLETHECDNKFISYCCYRSQQKGKWSKWSIEYVVKIIPNSYVLSLKNDTDKTGKETCEKHYLEFLQDCLIKV